MKREYPIRSKIDQLHQAFFRVHSIQGQTLLEDLIEIEYELGVRDRIRPPISCLPKKRGGNNGGGARRGVPSAKNCRGYGPITRARLRLGMTQERLAKRIGICVSHLSHIENARVRPTIEQASALALILDVPFHELRRRHRAR